MRSESVKASSWSCVTYKVVILKSFWSLLSSLRKSTRSLASKLDRGSSRQRILGSKTSARASATRCCCPPDSSETLRCNCFSVILIFLATSFTFSRIISGFIFLTLRPKAIFSYTVIVGKRAYDWKTIPISRASGSNRVTSRPPTSILPRVGILKPTRARKVVDLPQPEGPKKVKNSPS